MKIQVIDNIYFIEDVLKIQKIKDGVVKIPKKFEGQKATVIIHNEIEQPNQKTDLSDNIKKAIKMKENEEQSDQKTGQWAANYKKNAERLSQTIDLKKGKKIFLGLLTDLEGDFKEIEIEFINKELANNGFNEKQVLEIAKLLEEQGAIFKPKFGYYSLTQSVVKND